MNKIVFSTDEQYTRPIITLYGQQALIDKYDTPFLAYRSAAPQIHPGMGGGRI